VYVEKIRNIKHLQERITSAIETVTRDMIQKTWQEIEFRLDVYRATNGAHIEEFRLDVYRATNGAHIEEFRLDVYRATNGAHIETY